MFEISQLKEKKLTELQEIAQKLKVPKYRSLKKLDLVYQILDYQAANPKAVQEVNKEEKPQRQKRERVQRQPRQNQQSSKPDNSQNKKEESSAKAPQKQEGSNSNQKSHQI